MLFPVKTREGFGQACSAYMGGLRSFIEGIAGLAGIQWGAGQYTFHGTSGAWHLSSARFPGKPSKTMSTKRQPGELSRRLVLAGASWLYARIQLVALRAGKKFAIAICALRRKKRDFLSSRSGLNRRGRVAGCCIADAKSHRDALRRLFFAAQPGNTVGAG